MVLPECCSNVCMRVVLSSLSMAGQQFAKSHFVLCKICGHSSKLHGGVCDLSAGMLYALVCPGLMRFVFSKSFTNTILSCI